MRARRDRPAPPSRWRPSWRVRRGSGAYRLNVDLHQPNAPTEPIAPHIDFREALARDARPAGEFVLTQAGFTAGTLEHLGNIGKRRQSSLRASKQASSHKYCSPSDAHRQSIHLQKLRRRSRLASVCRNPKAQSRLLRFTLWRKRSSGVMPASFQAVTPVLKI